VSYATYYGGNQLQMHSRGMHPLKAKAVVLHLTKVLTKSYQEKDRPEQLVMLHELAHAVHDKFLGDSNSNVKTAYQQAMARKLYDKSLYIATNEHEFFAEASCAYLDRLEYFPKTREELKKHDPETFKLMEGVWGKAASAAALTSKANRPSDGSSEFNMDLPLAKVKWPKTLVGPEFKPGDVKGQVVLLGYVASSQTAITNRFKSWHDEFGPYGLSVVFAQAEYREEPEVVAKAFKKLDLPFSVLDPVFLPHKDGARAEKAGHAVVFDGSGAMIFRGQADDALLYLKEAIGRRLVAESGVSEGDLPKLVQAAVEQLKAGEALAPVANKLVPLSTNSDVAIAEPAKKLLAKLVEPGTKALAEAQALKKSDPLEAYLKAESIVVQFKGFSVATKASTLALELKGSPAVQPEVKARKDLEALQKIEANLSAQPGSFDPKAPQFRSRNGALLAQLQQAYAKMKKDHPKAKATEKAAAIAKEYGVE
jgi:hypothetical protein